MNEMNRLSRAKRNAIQDLEAEPPVCTLAIVATFGVTADVRGAGFLVDGTSRTRLIDLVQHLVADQEYTNLDEAAKLIELLELQMQPAYPEQRSGLFIRVHSDMISAPSKGKVGFDLADFLSTRLSDGRLRVTSESRLEQQDIHIEPKARSSAEPSAEGHRLAFPWRDDRVGTAWGPGWLSLLSACGLFGVGLGCAWAFWLRRSRAHRSLSQGRLQALAVQERTQNDRGESVGTRETRVGAAEGVPIVFSTDPNLGTYTVEPVDGLTVGELFRVEPLHDGLACVHSRNRNVRTNDKPLRVGQRVEVSLRERIRVDIAPYIFEISGVFSAPAPIRPGSSAFDAAPLQR